MKFILVAAALSALAGSSTADAADSLLSKRPSHRVLTVAPRAVVRPRLSYGAPGVGAPLDVPLGTTGLFVRTPFDVVAAGDHAVVLRVPPYEGPEGFETLTDEVQAINGIPCDDACSRRALRRWGYAPAY